MLPFALKGYLSPWLLPPVSLFLLTALGLLLARRWPRAGRWLAALSLFAGIALCLPVVADRLMAWVEAPYAQLDSPPRRLPDARQAAWRARPDQAPQAIVVLSGGTTRDGAASTQPDRIGSASLERILHARRLARLTALPILITGGVTVYGGEPEARLLRDVLEGDLATPVEWIETKSRDTSENAVLTREMLQPLGIRRVLLVTHAFHMRRAHSAFERAGFAVTPAPHSFKAGPTRFGWLQLVPTFDAIASSRLAVREIIGLAWYRLVALAN
jgi:uncharacterized SAM-binding protein YcdF (DUF218 family)